MNAGAPAPPDVSVVLACYNEESHLDSSVLEILATLGGVRSTAELIFVDDASTDGTRAVLERVLLRHQGRLPMRVLYHASNLGRGRTVADGMRAATGRIVGFLDVDLEVHARYIPAMVRAIEEGADVAIARRVYRITPSPAFLVRHVFSSGYRWLANRALGLGGLDTEAGYKFFRRAALLELLDVCHDPGWFWDTEIMAHARRRGLHIVEIPCLFLRRADKRSTLRLVPASLDYLRKLVRFRLRR